MVGQTIGHYKVVEKLGAGGMGIVWKAIDTHLDRPVAIKVLPPEKVTDSERKRRFIQEAKTASALNHPNIITIYDIANEGGTDFIVMEYVPGKALNQLILRKGLTVGESLKYAVQIADAMAAAHTSGILHRDLKPGNVMITEAPGRTGLVKVLDFGLAKLTEKLEGSQRELTETIREGDAADTAEGTIVGTVSYMSPEQAEGKKLDGRSDIFSFGAMLYEMVTGRRAFEGDSKLSILSAILRDEPKPANQIVGDLPRELERIIARCLRKSPERRFQTMADLKVALEDLKEESDSGVLRVAQVKSRQGKRLRWAAGLFLVLVAGAGATWFGRSRSKASETVLTAVPLTTYAGFQDDPTFSPDGTQVAFEWNGEKQDNFDIYVKLIGTAGPPLRLTNDPAPDYSPAWGPDGRYIAFLRDSANEKTDVLLIPALGGPERKLASVYRPHAESSSLRGPYVSWSPDGNFLVISDRNSTKEGYSLYLLSIETGEKRRLTSPPEPLLGDRSATFSPDGRNLAFSRLVDAGVSDLYLLELSPGLKPLGEPRPITSGNQGAVSPVWTGDGREVIYANWASRSGLWRVAFPRRGGRIAEPQQLTSLGPHLWAPAISRRGRRLAYAHDIYHVSIARMALQEGGLPLNGVLQSVITSSRDDSEPQFSPDEKRIAFVSERSGNPEIWVAASDGTNAVQLTSFGGAFVSTPRWSPAGDRIAFDSNAAGEFDIYVVPADGGKTQRMTTHPANDGNPSWSHDGRWIYFDSARSGEQHLFKIPAAGGDAIQVTHEVGFAPLESADGKFIYYTKALFSTGVWKVPAEGGQSVRIVDQVASYISLALVDTGLYFVPSKRNSIRFLSFANNETKTIAELPKPVDLGATGGGLSVSSDKRWILFSQLDQAGSELMLVENFH